MRATKRPARANASPQRGTGRTPQLPNTNLKQIEHEHPNPFHHPRRGGQGDQIGRSRPFEFRGLRAAVPDQRHVRPRRSRRVEKRACPPPPHRGSGTLCRSQVRGRLPARFVLRRRQRAQGDPERPCRLHPHLPERDAEALPLRRRAVQRGHDPGLPARQARLRVARHLGRRYARGRRVRRPRHRRRQQERSARLRPGHDPHVEDRHVRRGRLAAHRSPLRRAQRDRDGHRQALR